MAIINVSTWDQFILAYTQAVASGDSEDIIEIMADMDINATPITSSLTAGGTKIINGNYHTIRNIATSQVVSSTLFTAGGNRTISWNKVNFLNMYRNENYSFFAGASYYHMQFTDCTFQGKGFRLAENCDYNRCAVTWEFSQTINNAFGSCDFNYSWIHMELKRSSSAGFNFHKIDSCYVEGSVNGTTTGLDGWYFSEIMTNSVVNIDSDLTYNNGLAGSGVAAVCVYNNTKMPGNVGSQTNIVCVSDSDMHSAAALAAVGFNIIV